MHALIQTDRQLLIVNELINKCIISGGYRHVMWCINRGKRHVAARVAAIVPLCLSWLSFSLRLSLLLVFLLQTYF